jgi:hypothetical protein
MSLLIAMIPPNTINTYQMLVIFSALGIIWVMCSRSIREERREMVDIGSLTGCSAVTHKKRLTYAERSTNRMYQVMF